MHKFASKFAWFFRRTRDLIPTRLPYGITALDHYVKTLCEDYGIQENESYHHAVASMIMHLGPHKSHIPRLTLAKAIMKAQSNEVAFAKIEQIRDAKKQREAAQKLSEAPVEETPKYQGV